MNTRLTLVSVVAATSFLWGGVVSAQTSAPPQFHFYQGGNAFLSGYSLDAVYRMANNGTGSARRLNFRLYNSTADTFDAFRWDGSWNPLTMPSEHTFASARAGTFDGKYAGESDGDSNGIVPTYWSSSSSYSQNANGTDTGLYWDVNASGDCAGYYDNGSARSAIVRDSTGVHSLGSGSYSGSEARAINATKYVGGQVFSTNGSPPAVWTPSGGSWSLVLVSDSQDWPSGRDGYIVGVTDVKGGDSDGPYAVGWMTPGANEQTTPGQPFVYSVTTTRVKFCGTLYGEPKQVSNRDYDASYPVVSFCGNGPRPYVWIGDPDRSSANDGVADDMYAFVDPDFPVYSGTSGVSLSGMNRDFEFGGIQVTGSNKVWTTLGSDWAFCSDSPSLTLKNGTGVGGSTADLTYADGKFETVQKASPTSDYKDIEIWDEEVLPSGLYETNFSLSVRVTSRVEENVGTRIRKVSLWNWNNSSWDDAVSESADLFMLTRFGTLSGWSNISPYVRSSDRLIRAHVTFEPSGIVQNNSWKAGIEQLRVLVKP